MSARVGDRLVFKFSANFRVNLTGRHFTESTLPTDASTQKAAFGILVASRAPGFPQRPASLYDSISGHEALEKASFPDIYLNIGDNWHQNHGGLSRKDGFHGCDHRNCPSGSPLTFNKDIVEK